MVIRYVLEQLHRANTPSSDFLVGILSDIRRHNSCPNISTKLANAPQNDLTGYQANTKPANDSPNVQLCKTGGVEAARSLQNAADQEDDISDDESRLAAQLVAEIERGHCAEEAAGLKDRDNISGQIRIGC